MLILTGKVLSKCSQNEENSIQLSGEEFCVMKTLETPCSQDGQVISNMLWNFPGNILPNLSEFAPAEQTEDSFQQSYNVITYMMYCV